MVAFLILLVQDAEIDRALSYLQRELWKLPEAQGTPIREADIALATLAFVARGDSRYAPDIARGRRELARYLDRAEGTYQSNWPVAFSGWLYAELAARGAPDPASKRVVSILEAAQQRDGGWGHDSNHSEYASTYPRTLIVTTNACATALGLLQRQGVRVSGLDRAIGHYEKCQTPARGRSSELIPHLDKDGGFPYDARQNAGAEPGRTSGAWWAMWAAGASDRECARRAASFLRETLSDLPSGHASSALHVFTGAVACRLFGEEKEFRRLYQDRILRAQRKDGSFRCICGGIRFSCDEPDERFAAPKRVYITALYALALQTNRMKMLESRERPATPTK